MPSLWASFFREHFRISKIHPFLGFSMRTEHYLKSKTEVFNLGPEPEHRLRKIRTYDKLYVS